MSVLPVVARLFQKMDNGRISEIVPFDLNKAFDTVDHTILCQKLDQNGLQLNELLWLNSYPLNRKQLCRVGSCESDINNIDVHVPQGSCLRSLLFLITLTTFQKLLMPPLSSCTLMTQALPFSLRIFLNLIAPYMMISNTLIYGWMEISYR